MVVGKYIELLTAFLNAFFESEGNVITSVRYINKEMTPINSSLTSLLSTRKQRRNARQT